MLNFLSVRNLRSFGDDEQTIDIKPLTVIMGKNSSGKSSLIRSLFILRQTAEARDPYAAAVFDGDYAHFGSFHEFAHRHALASRVSVSWGFRTNVSRLIQIPRDIFSLSREVSRLPPNVGGRTVSIRLQGEFSYNRLTSEVRAEVVRLHTQFWIPGFPNVPQRWMLALSRERFDKNWFALNYASPELEASGRYRVKDTGKFYDVSLGRFHARDPRSGPLERRALGRLSAQIAATIETEAGNLRLLGPIRTEAQRFYLLTGARPSDVGLSGEKAIELLWMERRRSARLLQFMRRWLKNLDLSLDINLRRIPRTSFIAVELRDPHTGVDVQLADVGVGASQVLPILLGGFVAPPGSTLVVEQPELHLHPAAQSEVADALIELTGDNKNIIVETHSEHLVRRLQRRIAEGSLNASNLAIYYVEEADTGSYLTAIHLDKRGSFLGDELPQGFFDVDYKEAEAIADAWIKQREHAEA